MHNSFFFLRQLSTSLQQKLREHTLEACFSQNKDEIIFDFIHNDNHFIIQAILSPSFSCLSFPNEFLRAKKNSIDLFTPLIGKKIKNIIQCANERCFLIEFDSPLTLAFKLFGRHSNSILFEDTLPVDLFHKKMLGDYDLKLTDLNRDISHLDQTDPEQHIATHPLIDKHIRDYLYKNEWQKKSTNEKWILLNDTLSYLNHPLFYITQLNNMIGFSLFKNNAIIKTFTDPIEAITYFFQLYTKLFFLNQEKKNILHELEKYIKKNTNYIQKTEEQLRILSEQTPYEEIGHIIMANLSTIPEHAESVQLHNFYTDTLISIKLNKKLSAQKNAEAYYKKAKNRKIELDFLKKNIETKKNTIANYQRHIEAISQIETTKDLKHYLIKEHIQTEKKEEQKQKPYKEVNYEGFLIWIGKNASCNDQLTLHYTFKEDLWLHAKDVSGSHVVIKYQSGKKIPPQVIEKAAQLAAYYSKRKTDTLCPVMYTLKKYVRKPKGYPPGAVVVEKEKVILVEPASI